MDEEIILISAEESGERIDALLALHSELSRNAAQRLIEQGYVLLNGQPARKNTRCKENDLLEVMEACVDGTLDQINLQFEDNAAVCVVLASDGYPVSYEKGFEITGLKNFDGKDDYFCFHAGSKFADDSKTKILTNGGRVLGVTATGANLKEARKKAYEATEWVNFANKYMRHDIGKAIDEA